MKKLLIIRSVSFQQMDNNLQKIKATFPEHEIHILTHEHGKSLAEKYKDIDKVWVYPYRKGFSIQRKVAELKQQAFDVVVIPVTNISGAGFSNVTLFSLTIPAKKRYLCNLVSKIRPLSTWKIITRWGRNKIFGLIALAGTVVVAPLGILFLMVKYSIFKKT
jgi:ADP-heptose:LPS heptosyltransferase